MIRVQRVTIVEQFDGHDHRTQRYGEGRRREVVCSAAGHEIWNRSRSEVALLSDLFF